jgi:hypothetical protein
MASWKTIAGILAARMAETEGVAGGCPQHGSAWREHHRDCAYCEDQRAYSAWLEAGGHDFREPPYEGKSVSVLDLLPRHQAATKEKDGECIDDQ